MSGRFFLGLIAFLFAIPAYASSTPPGDSAPITVEAAPATASSLERSIEAVGSMVSNESVVISPEIAGRITEIHFEEGAQVKKGDVLFSLDDSIYKAQMSQARAALSLSQANHSRSRELFEKKITALRTVDETLAQRNTDAAAVELAQAQLDKATIRAPFDGIIGLRQVSIGDYVTAGQNLVNVESIDPLKVNFKIAEIYLASLKQGQKITATVDAFAGRSFEGEVYAIDPLIDVNARTVSLRAKLPNPDLILRPGLFARVKLVISTNSNAIMVDEQAMVPQGNEQFIYVIVDGKAVLKKVKTGQRRAGKVEITEGIKLGDQVITAGQMKLRPDAPVKAITPAVDVSPAAGGAQK